MLPALAPELSAHFQGRIASNRGEPGGYTPAGKEYADPTFSPTVCAFSYAHGGPKILHLNTATYGDRIYETCKFLRTHVLKRFPLPRIG